MGLPILKLLHEFLKNIWMSWKLLRPLSIKSCGCCRGIRTQWQRGLQGKRGWCLQEFFPQPWALTDSVLRNLTRIRSATLWDTLYPISLALLHEPTLLSSVLSLHSLTHCIQRKDHWKPVFSPFPSAAELSWSSINILPWVSFTRVLHSWHCLCCSVILGCRVRTYLLLRYTR